MTKMMMTTTTRTTISHHSNCVSSERPIAPPFISSQLMLFGFRSRVSVRICRLAPRLSSALLVPALRPPSLLTCQHRRRRRPSGFLARKRFRGFLVKKRFRFWGLLRALLSPGCRRACRLSIIDIKPGSGSISGMHPRDQF